MIFKSEHSHKVESSSTIKVHLPLIAEIMDTIEVNGKKFYPVFKEQELFHCMMYSFQRHKYFVEKWISY